MKALELANQTDKVRLKELYSQSHTNDEQKVQEVLDIFNKHQIFDLTRNLMDDYYKKAMVFLKEIDF